MKCSLCGSERLRLSRLRRPDFMRLFMFSYPVRCVTCYERMSVSLFTALRIHRDAAARKRTARGGKHSAPSAKANGV